MNNNQNLTTKTSESLKWTSLSQIIRQIAQFTVLAFLARLLTPVDFGLIGMLTVFTGFGVLFGEMGFSAALIQAKSLNNRQISSIFWINLFVGIFLTLIFTFCSGLIVKLYNEQQLANLVIWVAPNFVLISFGLVQKSLMLREMEFKKLSMIEIVASLCSYTVALALAILGYGVLSLVWQMLIMSLSTTVLLWFFSSWRPQFVFHWAEVKKLTQFSLNLFGFKSYNYWARNADNLLIGKLLGTDQLGLYARAYSLMLLPSRQISSVINNVMFSALSKIQDDKEKTKAVYLRLIKLLALVSFPVMLGLAACANNFVLVVLGDQWVEMITPLRILCFVGAFQSVASSVGLIYQAQGRTDIMFKWGLASVTLVLVSFAIGIWVGTITAVCLCYLFVSIILSFWNFSIPGSLIGMSNKDVFQALYKIIIMALSMFVIVFIFGSVLQEALFAYQLLSIQVMLGVGFYTVLVYQFEKETMFQVLQLINRK